jgi:hypothetical protein
MSLEERIMSWPRIFWDTLIFLNLLETYVLQDLLKSRRGPIERGFRKI